MIQASLGKLIKRIKTVTMGLILGAKKGDVTACALMFFTSEHEPGNKNLE